MKLPRRTPRIPTDTIHPQLATNTDRMFENMTVTKDGAVLAGYRVGPVRWEFTSLPERERAIDRVWDGFAALADKSRAYQERVTTRPHAVTEWARNLDLRTPRPMPAVHDCDPGRFSDDEMRDGLCGCDTWAGELLRGQQAVHQAGMNTRVVFRYVEIGSVKPGTDLHAVRVANVREGIRVPDEYRQIFATERRVRDAVSTMWDGRPMRLLHQEGLRHRSLAMGHPTPLLPIPTDTDLAGWDPTSMGAFAASVRWHEEPWDDMVKVSALRAGKWHHRYVRVLTAAKLPDFDGASQYPGNGWPPWQMWAGRLRDPHGRGIPVEWNTVGRFATGDELAGTMERELLTAMNIAKGYVEDGDAALVPGYVQRGIAAATQNVDNSVSGDTRDSSRFVGSVNVAVWGEDTYDEQGRQIGSGRDQCLERAQAFQDHYASAPLRQTWVGLPAQWVKLREFITGEPIDTVGQQRRPRLDYLAVGLPNVSTAVGDEVGMFIGETVGSDPQPVMHDSHFNTEGRGAIGRGTNFHLVAGELGSGKSYFAGVLADGNVYRGTKTLVDDPPGRLAVLCHQSASFEAVSLDLNLTKSPPGILSPAALLPEPVRADFLTDERGLARSDEQADAAFARAVAGVNQERSRLSQDMLRGCLPADLHGQGETQAVLRDAARAVRWWAGTSLHEIVAELRKGGDHARQVALALDDAAGHPRMALMFAPPADSGDFVEPLALHGKLLVVTSTPGVSPADDGKPRRDWTADEIAAKPLLYLAKFFTMKQLYGTDPNSRKVVIFDEAETMTDGGEGRAALAKLGRDHSKNNIAVYLLVKNMNSTVYGGELKNFIASIFAGKMASDESAEEWLKLLGIRQAADTSALTGLNVNTAGEFIHRDVHRRHARIRVIAKSRRLHELLLTNPNQDPNQAEAWALQDVFG